MSILLQRRGSIAASGAVFGRDSFTDTSASNLSSHVGEYGATWTLQPGNSVDIGKISNAGRVRTDNLVTFGIYYSSLVPNSADYDVYCDVVWMGGTPSGHMGPAARVSTGSENAYFVRWVGSLTAWQLFKDVAGTQTQLGSNVSQTLTVGQNYRCKLSLRGTSIVVTIDGAAPIFNTTDASISAAGRAGLWVKGGTNENDSSGVHCDNFLAVNA